MKNIAENIALILVLILSGVIGYLIYQYNTLEDNIYEDTSLLVHVPKKETKPKENTSNYLNTLEAYGDDKDVQVDVKKEDSANRVVAKSEIKEDTFNTVVEDKTKSAYTQNLENYAKESSKEKLDTLKPVKDNLDEPEKLPQDTIKDDIGMAIDAALDNL